MDKTNYAVLSIVAIVAVTAVVSMFLTARAPVGGIASPTEVFAVTANAIFDTPRSGSVGITGFVVDGDARAADAAPRGDPYDLNDNGVLDPKDAEILGQVIDRVQFCPRTKKCDLDRDHVIDVQDLGLLNARILEARAQTSVAYVPSGPSAGGNGITGNVAADASESIGATGGLA